MDNYKDKWEFGCLTAVEINMLVEAMETYISLQEMTVDGALNAESSRKLKDKLTSKMEAFYEEC